jgi:hypothetical protein
MTMATNSDKCSTRYCRKPVSLTVRGRPLCDSCWEKYCDTPAKPLIPPLYKDIPLYY